MMRDGDVYQVVSGVSPLSCKQGDRLMASHISFAFDYNDAHTDC